MSNPLRLQLEPESIPTHRPPRPTQEELETVIAFLYRIPEDSVPLLKNEMGLETVELYAQAEEFLLMLGQLDQGQIAYIDLPERRPEHGQYYSYTYQEARWAVERYGDA